MKILSRITDVQRGANETVRGVRLRTQVESFLEAVPVAGPLAVGRAANIKVRSVWLACSQSSSLQHRRVGNSICPALRESALGDQRQSPTPG